MTTIYLMRHGETSWNIMGKCQGRIDNPLNEKGKAQAKEKALQLKEQNFHVDAILSSSLYRAYQTAEILASILGYSRPIEKKDAFVEREFGALEGQDVNFVRKTLREHLEDQIEGYEHDENLVQRVKKGLVELGKEYDQKQVLVVAHSHAIKGLLSSLEPEKYSFFTYLPNLNLTKLIVDGEKITIQEFRSYEK